MFQPPGCTPATDSRVYTSHRQPGESQSVSQPKARLKRHHTAGRQCALTRDGCRHMHVGASAVGGCSCAPLTLPPRAPLTHAASAPCTAGACAPRKGMRIRSALFVTRDDGRAQQQHNAPFPSSRMLNERVHGSDSEEADAIEIRFFFPQA